MENGIRARLKGRIRRVTPGWKKDGGKTASNEKESGGTGMDGGVKSGPERDKNDGRSENKKNRAGDEWCDGAEAFLALIFYDRWRVFPFLVSCAMSDRPLQSCA